MHTSILLGTPLSLLLQLLYVICVFLQLIILIIIIDVFFPSVLTCTICTLLYNSVRFVVYILKLSITKKTPITTTSNTTIDNVITITIIE